jgi:small conductance mechanosensitive channel
VIQLPAQLPTPDSLRPQFRINWNELLVPDVLARNLGRVLIILIVAFVAYRLVKLLVRRIVTHEVEAEDPVVKRLREQRAQTLGSLLQNVALVVIITLAGLTILGTFMPIGPLLAGVSVIGLAVSFGAQSLVKDIISGTFILLEGQFGIGDVVRIGDTSGQVERITLRTTVLRDFEGIVHIIPNGEITKVSNLTKTWSRAVLDIGVAYREDVDRVIAVLHQLGEQFLADPQWGPLLLEAPDVLGVQSLADSAVVIRMQARTLPLKQWDVARELRRRIKNRFDREDIQIPFPHLTFYWGDQQSPFTSDHATPGGKSPATSQ